MSAYLRPMRPTTSGSWIKVARKTYRYETSLVVRFDDNHRGWEIIGASRFDGVPVRHAMGGADGGDVMRSRLATRRSVYRGFPGWLVCGVDAKGRRVDVFVSTREDAEQVKVNIGAGRPVFDGLAAAR